MDLIREYIHNGTIQNNSECSTITSPRAIPAIETPKSAVEANPCVLGTLYVIEYLECQIWVACILLLSQCTISHVSRSLSRYRACLSVHPNPGT